MVEVLPWIIVPHTHSLDVFESTFKTAQAVGVNNFRVTKLPNFRPSRVSETDLKIPYSSCSLGVCCAGLFGSREPGLNVSRRIKFSYMQMFSLLLFCVIRDYSNSKEKTKQYTAANVITKLQSSNSNYRLTWVSSIRF